MLFLLMSSVVYAQTAPVAIRIPDPTSLAENISPKNYKKRTEPILNIGLIYYGDYYTEEQFAELQALLEKRFEQATHSLLKLKVVFRAIIPFKENIQKYPAYFLPNITDVERLQRLWYYDNINMKIASEVWNEAKSHNLYGKDISSLDALAVVTGAQFDGLGFASGRVAITENPMEIYWAGPTGGHVEYLSHASVVDELIHELGHALYIDHAAHQCVTGTKTLAERDACCAQSENRDDVLSYCRSRSAVNEDFFYGFKDCNLKNIQEIVIPAMLSGDKWIQKMTKCE